jgi:hypothetical protein
MKHLMWKLGVDPIVVPNGLGPDAFELPNPAAVSDVRRASGRRPIFAKVARWDPDKRWLLTMDIIGALKRAGYRPLLVARGGMEAHGHEVMAWAKSAGLRVVERALSEPGPRGLLGALERAHDADVITLRTQLDVEARRTLFRAASAVLANLPGSTRTPARNRLSGARAVARRSSSRGPRSSPATCFRRSPSTANPVPARDDAAAARPRRRSGRHALVSPSPAVDASRSSVRPGASRPVSQAESIG